MIDDTTHKKILETLDKKLIKHPSATFFVRVSGTSMINAKIFDGSIFLVDKAEKIKNDDIIIKEVKNDRKSKQDFESN